MPDEEAEVLEDYHLYPGNDEVTISKLQLHPTFHSARITGSLASLDVIPPILTVTKEDAGTDTEHRNSMHARSHPDEDRHWAWVVFIFIFIGRIVVNGTLVTFNIYFSLFLEVFRESRSVTAFIGSVMWAMYDGSGLICAVVVSRLGARLSIIVGGFVLTCSFLLSTCATDAVHLIFTFGVLVGLIDLRPAVVKLFAVICCEQTYGPPGTGANLVSMAFVVGLRTYFRKYVYLVQGVSTAGAGLGMFMFGSALPRFIEGYGWSGTLVIHGAILLNVCVVGCVVFPIRKSYIETTKPLTPVVEVSFRVTSRQLFSSAQFWCEVAAFFCFNFSYATAIVLYKDYVIMRGLQDHFSSALFAFGAGDIVGRLGSGFMTSYPRINPVAFSSVVHVTNSVVLFLLMIVGSRTGLLAVSSLYGACAGCANGLFFILPCHLYPTETFLVAFAYLCLAAGCGSFIGTPTAGFLIDQTKSYDGALIFTGAFALMAGVMHFVVYLLRRSAEKRTLKQGLPLKVIQTHEEAT